MNRIALTLGTPHPSGGWPAVTDRGEQVEVPAAAATGLALVRGQRVVAHLDEAGAVVRVGIGGSSLLSQPSGRAASSA